MSILTQLYNPRSQSAGGSYCPSEPKAWCSSGTCVATESHILLFQVEVLVFHWGLVLCTQTGLQTGTTLSVGG
jgi:hypothetical protein